jgi:serine/threonine protein phosphatase PrpC
MGVILPKPVTPIVVERYGGAHFRVGFAEMNGWPRNMEDAHVVVTKDKWGFFGVFDGHGGDQCSNFIMKHLTKELEEKGAPADDAGMKELMLRLDREFLATGLPSGSTGTFALVEPLADDASQYKLRVGNIGDSRVVLGRADGSIADGPGTDSGLTIDHKPDHPTERARIERTGGHVEMVQGVARVNGDLSVCRAFGDAQHKETGGPGQEDHPVTVDPEFTTVNCNKTDFLLLVCDGISEGEFPNPKVVELAAEKLREGGDNPDPAEAAACVCRQALKTGSRDNLSCMIVLLGGGELSGPSRGLLSGPFSAPEHSAFRAAYTAMAKHAGLTLAQAVELRYDDIRKESPETLLEASKHELKAFGDGPPSNLTSGTDERTKWFQDWLDAQKVEKDLDPSTMTAPELLEMLEEKPEMLAMAQAQGMLPSRLVSVVPKKQLKAAFAASSSLKWSESHEQLCGALGVVIFNDPHDGTSRVKFPSNDGDKSIFVWLPAGALIDVPYDNDDGVEGRLVKVAPVDQLRPAIEASSALKWSAKIEEVCGQTGAVLQDDTSDGTSKVRFPPPLGFTAWLPTSALIDMEDQSNDAGDAADAESEEASAKRQRTE